MGHVWTVPGSRQSVRETAVSRSTQAKALLFPVSKRVECDRSMEWQPTCPDGPKWPNQPYHVLHFQFHHLSTVDMFWCVWKRCSAFSRYTPEGQRLIHSESVDKSNDHEKELLLKRKNTFKHHISFCFLLGNRLKLAQRNCYFCGLKKVSRLAKFVICQHSLLSIYYTQTHGEKHWEKSVFFLSTGTITAGDFFLFFIGV